MSNTIKIKPRDMHFVGHPILCRALCGSKTGDVAGTISEVTCPKCIERIKSFLRKSK